MEPSKTYETVEEGHSSESGWTMYIVSSSIHGGHSEKADDDGQSDDSMASDASSGPRHGTTRLSFKHEEEDDESFFPLDKRGKKSMEKQKLGSMRNKQDKEVKKQTPLKAKRAVSDPCPSGKILLSITTGKATVCMVGDTLSCTWGSGNFSNIAKDLDSSKAATPLANATATGLGRVAWWRVLVMARESQTKQSRSSQAMLVLASNGILLQYQTNAHSIILHND